LQSSSYKRFAGIYLTLGEQKCEATTPLEKKWEIKKGRTKRPFIIYFNAVDNLKLVNTIYNNYKKVYKKFI
jgi:hypothetical protein